MYDEELRNVEREYESWSTEELVRSVYIEKDQYNPEAIALMSTILRKRNIDKSAIDVVQADIQTQAQSEKVWRVGRQVQILELITAFGDILLAYYTSRKELPSFLQMNNPALSALFLCLSIMLICKGILQVTPLFPWSLRIMFAPETKIIGYCRLVSGTALLLLWLNRKFGYPALYVSSLAFVTAAVLYAIDVRKLAIELRAKRNHEGSN